MPAVPEGVPVSPTHLAVLATPGRASRRATVVAGAVLLALVSLAILHPSGASTVPAGSLYFTAFNTTAGAADANCIGPQTAYGLAATAPTSSEGRKAYLPGSLAVPGCSTSFQFNVTFGFQFHGAATAVFSMGCDQVSVNAGAPVPDTTSSVRVALIRNGATLGTTFWTSPVNACTSAALQDVSVDLSTKDTAYHPGDLLALKVTSYWLNPPSDKLPDVYVLAESLAHPATLVGSGLLPVAPASATTSSAANETTATTPSNTSSPAPSPSASATKSSTAPPESASAESAPRHGVPGASAPMSLGVGAMILAAVARRRPPP